MVAIDTMLLFTHNPGKAAEFEHLLQSASEKSIRFVSARTYEPALIEPEETGVTFLENALIKACSGVEQTGLPTLADDSGLCVDALFGEPGVRSSRFAQDLKFAPEQAKRQDGSIDKTIANNILLLQKLKSVPEHERQARFKTTLALALPSKFRDAVDKQGTDQVRVLEEHPLLKDDWFAITAQGCVEGEITSVPHGDGGFGYDPVFFCHELEKTFGDATTNEKSAVSHRARALENLQGFLRHTGLL